MPDPLWKPSDFAAYIDRPEKTLAEWRYRGIGPKYIKVQNGYIRYRRSDVEAWLAAATVEPAAGAA